MKRLAGPEKTHDVHMKVGFWFILACLLLGFVLGGCVPFLADRAGVLHMGSTKPGVVHLELKDALLFGAIGCLFGAWNGVLLSINKALWWLGLLCALVPCGFFGGCAAALTPHPYSQSANGTVFWIIPVLVSGSAAVLRKVVWDRYEKPLVRSSKNSG